MNKPVSKKPCLNLWIFGIIICDLVTLAFSIVIFVKAHETLYPKEGDGLIGIAKMIIYLFYLLPSIGFWVHSILLFIINIISKYRNKLFGVRLAFRATALAFIGIVSYFGYAVIKYWTIIPPFFYIISLVLDILYIKYSKNQQEMNNNNYSIIV